MSRRTVLAALFARATLAARPDSCARQETMRN